MKNLYIIITVLILALVFSCTETKKQKPDLAEQEVVYISDSTNLKGFLVYDNNIKGERPGVLIVHEWWGLNEYARSRARMLAELGYTAFAVDMFGDGKTATHPEDAQKFASAIFSTRRSNEPEITPSLLTLNVCGQTIEI